MDGAAELTLLEACWRTVVLGIVQGLTEFLPISSTAHLKVVPVLAGWGDPGVAVTAVIQLGSIAAVIGYFRRDLLQVCRGLARALREGDWGSNDARLGIAIAVGTLPVVVAGLAIKLFWPGYETSPLRSVASIGIVSIVMALLLALAEQLGQRRKQLPQVQGADGVVVGLAQALAIIPGVSRSGSTLTASLLFGWQDQGLAFDTAVHLGSLLALVAFFWRDLRRLTVAGSYQILGKSSADGRYAINLLIASLPIIPIGFFMRFATENEFRNLHVIAATTIIFSLVLRKTKRELP